MQSDRKFWHPRQWVGPELTWETEAPGRCSGFSSPCGCYTPISTERVWIRLGAVRLLLKLFPHVSFALEKIPGFQNKC